MVLGIFGAGSLGKEVLDILFSNEKKEEWQEIIFIDDITRDLTVNGIRIKRYADVKKEYDADDVEIVIASGETYYREKLVNKVRTDGFRLAKVISDKAHIGFGSKIAEGCIIFPYVYVGVNSCISENVIVHAGAKIESNCIIDRNSFVSLGAFVGANTDLGTGVFVGPNAVIKDHIAIGDYAVIGMGTVVTKDVETENVMVGNPAKLLRKNENKKIFQCSITGNE